MNNFFKYLFTVILAIIGLNILFKVIGITMHFLFPLLGLALVVYLLYRIWGNPRNCNRRNSSKHDRYEW
ncbi:hypothetical protein BMT55_09480 [Listeria newyorkensis]|uniref:Uncharacterized protein n=1 Tax=Listeria newyorkensis TaxID=1497681 RepID=A0ABX4XMA4_9LIST|nr:MULTISPECIES: hypothetical protein [Listeria]KGL46882.1 hypothetical protein EP56_00125 [Listeriaceae bacterium FSL A5-0209]KGL39246.1 hypothetical protein EP58_13875 [Listeria newyorkensis]KMT58135.1 hypothetical protein X559_3094 [Listeria newyorkensis]PNP91928.1 hypothetical protein BMT55_09480 [Listeria newyorkensis]RQW66162.1 hypothetical protein DUK53_12530 [Listeria sp. SHR_NRA_18]